ncbi:glycosyltransferase [Flavobacterium hungaricum]|uniref:Glycosyltransferase n=1 Tax=Flavobacterium hungaricum TaxID=2082725 RepID=A0ABR9TNW5_9FLAO|nr:glycosyltransferase [Flavobacterium hungaricum]MBE8727052.1 glycosyltransferase [Flavobacterium hungaricum]
MIKTAVFYHYLASYRGPVFTELMKSRVIEFTIYSGLESEIDIMKIDEKKANDEVCDGGLRWRFLKNRWIFKNRFLWQSGLISVILFEKYDSFIFLGSPYHITTWVGVLIAKFKRKKTYYWMHGFYNDKLGIVDFMKIKLFYKLPTGFFLYGNRSRSILKKHRVKSDKNMHVIYNSLDYEESLKQRYLISKDDVFSYRRNFFNDEYTPVVVFIGRLNDVKKLDMLINAQHLLYKTGKTKFNIIIVGDGEKRISLEKQALKLGLEDNVKFLGAVFNEKINSEVLMFADLCVVPGEVGLTAMHALSYGTPVISHNNFNIQMPEVEAIKVGVTGDLFCYGNTDSLSETIHQWLLKHPLKEHNLMNACFSVIDTYYNPIYQRKVFESVLLKS